MIREARDLLDSLSGRQRHKTVFAFDDAEERLDWHYIPRPRRGLPLADMDATQATLTFRLVASGLSRAAYGKATAIVMLERVLDEIEGRRRGRDPGLYFVSIFGAPSDDEPWGWRFEGHHISLNYTVVDGKTSWSPLFFGANPARLAVAPLAEEEDLGRDVARRAPKAVFSDLAPDDILTEARRQAPERLEPAGITHAPGIDALTSLYLGRLPASLSSQPSAHDTWFAWAGGLEPGQGHYYRVQAPGLLIEYDNTQDGANHVHTVVRRPDDDFGASMLQRHAEAHH